MEDRTAAEQTHAVNRDGPERVPPLTRSELRAQLHVLIDQLPDVILQATLTLLQTTRHILPTVLMMIPFL